MGSSQNSYRRVMLWLDWDREIRCVVGLGWDGPQAEIVSSSALISKRKSFTGESETVLYYSEISVKDDRSLLKRSFSNLLQTTLFFVWTRSATLVERDKRTSRHASVIYFSHFLLILFFFSFESFSAFCLYPSIKAGLISPAHSTPPNHADASRLDVT